MEPVLIEEQRKAVWLLLYSELTDMATVHCGFLSGRGPSRHACSRTSRDYNFLATLVAKMPKYRPKGPISWPPRDCSLRFILKEIHCCGSGTYFKASYSCDHGEDFVREVDGATIEMLCSRVNKTVLGLCLTCLQAAAEDTVPAKCSHQLLRWVKNDAFI